MAIKLKDLEVKDELDFFPGRKYDMEKVLALSDKNFAEFYLLKMR